MTSTGIFGSGGIVEFAPSLYGTDDDPMDATVMRDGVLHGLMHACDSMAQVRVNYHPIDSGVATDQTSFEPILSSAVADTWYQFGASPMGEWPLTLRADGTPYKLRIRIGAAMSASGATGKIRVVIAPRSRIDRVGVAAAIDSIYQATFTSTTIAWIGSTSAISMATETQGLVSVGAAQARAWTRDVACYNAVRSPAAGTTVEQCLVSAHVYGSTNVATKLPRLHALHISEFVA